MAKINISLVGGQPMPVYALILEQKPDRIYLIHSAQTKALAERIKSITRRSLPTAAIVLQELAVGLHEADRDIRAYAQVWSEAGSEVVVNISGGTKPWSLLFYRHFSQQDNARCVFIDQNNVIWNLKTLESHKANLGGLKLDDIFRLNNVRITTKTDFNSYTAQDRKDCDKIEKLFRTNWKAMKDMTYWLSEDEGKGRVAVGKSKISYQETDKSYICHVESGNGFHKCDAVLNSPHARDLLLNTGWFEYRVASFLHRWPMAKQIWMNVHFTSGPTGGDHNEVDIIVETTVDKLLFVECKTQVYNITDINKFNDVVKNNGGLGSKKVFITLNPMKGEALAKSEQVGMPHYALQDISQPAHEAAFFGWLSNYMGDINEK